MNLAAAETKFRELTKNIDRAFSTTFITTEKNDRCISVDCHLLMLINDDLVTFHGRGKTKQEAFSRAAAAALAVLLDHTDSFWLEHPSLKINNSDESD